MKTRWPSTRTAHPQWRTLRLADDPSGSRRLFPVTTSLPPAKAVSWSTLRPSTVVAVTSAPAGSAPRRDWRVDLDRPSGPAGCRNQARGRRMPESAGLQQKLPRRHMALQNSHLAIPLGRDRVILAPEPHTPWCAGKIGCLMRGIDAPAPIHATSNRGAGRRESTGSVRGRAVSWPESVVAASQRATARLIVTTRPCPEYSSVKPVPSTRFPHGATGAPRNQLQMPRNNWGTTNISAYSSGSSQAAT